jgi:hypothetical protein
MSYTPGPWRVRNPRHIDLEPFVEANKTNLKAGYNIEIIGSEDGENYPSEQRLADCFLVACAPELLEALEEMTNIYYDHLQELARVLLKDYEATLTIHQGILLKAKELIKKAKGEQ